MGLAEELKEMKKELADIEATPEKEKAEEPAVEQEEETEVESEAATEEKPAEDADKVDDEPAVENPTSADFARMRREKKALERKLAEVEAAKATPPAAAPEVKESKADVDPEPDRSTKYELWLEWKDRQLERKVADIEEKFGRTLKEKEGEKIIGEHINRFTSFENDFKAIEPAYDAAATFYGREMAKSVKLLNPGLTQKQMADIITEKLLVKADQDVKRGLDPAEELYNEAISLGFKMPTAEADAEEELKPNLSRVAANKARNAGTAGARGRGGSVNITRETAGSMSNAEWAKLPKSEKQRILKG